MFNRLVSLITALHSRGQMFYTHQPLTFQCPAQGHFIRQVFQQQLMNHDDITTIMSPQKCNHDIGDLQLCECFIFLKETK